MALSAAIYARISKDDGTALGVRRQESDCRDLAARRGWDVGEVIIDNDVSAYSGKLRKGYQRLVDGIDNGTFDALVVWHPDRLHRSPKELETFIDLVEQTGVAVATCTAGDYNLATPEGRLTARIVGSVARKESEDKSRRLRRKHQELAEAGRVSGGGRRPFGYEADKVTIRESEAAEIRAAVARVLAGESLRSITLDWQRREVATVTGASWAPTTVKRLLTSPRIAGQREHNGKVSAAVWPAIIDVDESAKVRAILTARKGTRSPRSYLLSGLVWCARCEVPMTSAPVVRKGHRYPRYACAKDRGGCGRCGIAGQPLEALVVENVLDVLDSPALETALSVVAADGGAGGADSIDEVAQLEERMASLAEMFAAGEIDRSGFRQARESIEQRLQDARSAVVDDARSSTVTALMAARGGVREAWPNLTLDQRRTVIAEVVERVWIAPTTKANNRFDPARLATDWRV